ncbi:HelD family protein [Schaalia suimastitidis]|uniref:HelD family protein n=1 Tax=Schaalia suimastitidis TaxID=121163 RepID=UPI0004040FEA|nr:AAA family ATPase [Schaalia suimastitidis]
MPDHIISADPTDELRHEQQFVDTAYARLDEVRGQYRQRQVQAHATHGVGNAQGWSERDAISAHFGELAARLDGVEERLVFGRLDLSSGDTHYIGRTSLSDDSGTPLLLDWRAPASAPFYRATAVHPQGVVRRRHISTRQRSVVAIEDELLDSAAAESAGMAFQGEGALMAALGKAREGRMGDIVATIQSEQDQIIRADDNGLIVVQGGPGTGKTAVALHRAAYLLHANRERLERSGVLLVGPSRVFLRYIEKVLPSLGETGVVSITIGDLVPGVRARESETPEVAHIKGLAVWSKILEHAVRDLVKVPESDQVLTVWNRRVRLLHTDVVAAVRHARRGGRPHNVARDTFARDLMKILAERLVTDHAQPGSTPDPEEVVTWTGEIRDSTSARRAINLAWMPTRATTLLKRLWAKPALLARLNREVGSPLSAQQLAAVFRQRDAGFTAADVPLLDELEELLGTCDVLERNTSKESTSTGDEVERAREAMESMGLGGGIVSAEMLAASAAGVEQIAPLAERAASDRTWTYGHIVVDEAQDLSPMAWRALLRRCPSRSFTVVGDLDQKRGKHPASSWEDALGPAARALHAQYVLSVSYRTPRTLTRLAEGVLARAGAPVLHPTHAVRDVEDCYQVRSLPPGTPGSDEAVRSLAGTAARHACERLDADQGEGQGRVAVIVGSSRAQAWGADTIGATSLTERVSLLSAGAAKGLEFDSVIVVEPSEILADGPGDLFVALTRATHDLTVVHASPLPGGMEEWE